MRNFYYYSWNQLFFSRYFLLHFFKNRECNSLCSVPIESKNWNNTKASWFFRGPLWSLISLSIVKCAYSYAADTVYLVLVLWVQAMYCLFFMESYRFFLLFDISPIIIFLEFLRNKYYDHCFKNFKESQNKYKKYKIINKKIYIYININFFHSLPYLSYSYNV